VHPAGRYADAVPLNSKRLLTFVVWMSMVRSETCGGGGGSVHSTFRDPAQVQQVYDAPVGELGSRAHELQPGVMPSRQSACEVSPVLAPSSFDASGAAEHAAVSAVEIRVKSRNGIRRVVRMAGR
jgi:hypothetical protein